MTASPRRSRLDGVRLVAVEARWLRLHINTMAITPRQRRLDGCGLAIRCRCTRPDHVDNHGAAQANDEQHQDHRHREWRLRPLRGFEDIRHLPVPLPVSAPMRPLPVLYDRPFVLCDNGLVWWRSRDTRRAGRWREYQATSSAISS